MYTIGMTGGIGSGKTAAAQAFRACGATVIDLDDLAREVTVPGSVGLARLIETYGEEILHPDGELNRGALRDIAFASTGSLARLESILHPLIFSELENHLKTLTVAYVIVIVPILVEKQLMDRFDRILVIDLPEELQVLRAARRDGTSDDAIRQIMAQQVSRAARLAVADDVILNDGAILTLKSRCKELHERYRALGMRQGRTQ